MNEVKQVLKENLVCRERPAKKVNLVFVVKTDQRDSLVQTESKAQPASRAKLVRKAPLAYLVSHHFVMNDML